MQEIHPRLQRHVKNRLQTIEKGTGLDWATAEVGRFLPYPVHLMPVTTSGHGTWIIDARKMRCPDLGAGRWTRDI